MASHYAEDRRAYEQPNMTEAQMRSRIGELAPFHTMRLTCHSVSIPMTNPYAGTTVSPSAG